MKNVRSISTYGFLSLLTPILLCLIAGFISSRFQSNSMEVWYPSLRKSYFTPSPIVFPIAWTFLYICMGLSVGLIGYLRRWRLHWLMTLFAFQLFLNFIWTFFFFYLESPLLGLIDILLLDVAVFIYIIWSYPRYRLSSILFMPYMAWLLLASYLNFYIWYYN
ncbi:MAG: TspO/MBR family protein [Phocaeicola sp.]